MADPTFGLSITRIDNEPRTPVWSDMSVLGIIGTAPAAAADTKSRATIGTGNAALTFTSKLAGVLGNAIDVRFVAPAGANAALAVVVTGNDIVVNLATGATAGVVTTTAAQIITAIAASAPANALVAVANAVGSTGASVVAGMAAPVFLTGGVDEPFPLNTPVMFFSDDPTALKALGATGTLGDAIALVNAQMGEFQASARVIVVRVAEGVNPTATIANIVGDGISTGLSAFLDAGELLGYTPRLLAAPGFTSQRTGSDANAVCAALPAICAKLLAHAVVDGPATTMQAALGWRETIASERLIPVDPAVRVLESGLTVVQPLSPAILGIAVRRDHEKGGRPFHSWANQPVYGILGPSRPIRFSLTDGNTEGQSLLAANIGILIRSERGSDGALADGGFVFIGTDNAGNDDLWRFYNVTRGRDFIHLAMIKTVRTYLGRFNITQQTVQAILNTMDTVLRDLKAAGDILGYRVSFQPDRNSPENLRAGKLVVTFEAEEAPVLRHIGIQSARYRPAVEALIADLATV